MESTLTGASALITSSSRWTSAQNWQVPKPETSKWNHWNTKIKPAKHQNETIQKVVKSWTKWSKLPQWLYYYWILSRLSLITISQIVSFDFPVTVILFYNLCSFPKHLQKVKPKDSFNFPLQLKLNDITQCRAFSYHYIMAIYKQWHIQSQNACRFLENNIINWLQPEIQGDKASFLLFFFWRRRNAIWQVFYKGRLQSLKLSSSWHSIREPLDSGILWIQLIHYKGKSFEYDWFTQPRTNFRIWPKYCSNQGLDLLNSQ